MTTETTGDHAWTEGAMMRGTAITLTISNAGKAQTVSLYLEQNGQIMDNGYVKTTYSVVSPNGESLDSYLNNNLDPRNYAGFIAVATGQGSDVTGNFLSNTHSYVECNETLAVTPNGAEQSRSVP